MCIPNQLANQQSFILWIQRKIVWYPNNYLSVFAGSFSVGADPFAKEELISVINCRISKVITILTSIKIFMKIQENQHAEQELAI